MKFVLGPSIDAARKYIIREKIDAKPIHNSEQLEGCSIEKIIFINGYWLNLECDKVTEAAHIRKIFIEKDIKSIIRNNQ